MKRKSLQDYSYLLILLAVLAALTVLMAVASPYFFSWKNCRNILNQSAIYLILSVGMTFVICAGQIDLSVGAVIGFAGVSMGLFYHAGLPAGAAILTGLLISAAVGLVNGIFVAYGKINSFIVTWIWSSVYLYRKRQHRAGEHADPYLACNGGGRGGAPS